MAVREILLLGNPRLNKRSEPVQATELPVAVAAGRDLQDTQDTIQHRHLDLGGVMLRTP